MTDQTSAEIVRAIARIVDPNAMSRYEADFAKSRSPTWDQIAAYPSVKIARDKADAINALFASLIEALSAEKAVQDTYLIGGPPDLKAMSGSVESDRVLQLHFNRKVNDADRAWLLDAINEKLAAESTVARLTGEKEIETQKREFAEFEWKRSDERAAAAEARLAEAAQNFRAIKQATVDGRVCDDVAWFDAITTLHDFCELAAINCAVGGS